MIKKNNLKLRKFSFLSFVFIFAIFLFSLNFISADNCAQVATTNVFKVVNSVGQECLRIDTDGDVWFKNYPVPNEGGLATSLTRKEFVIGSSSTVMKIDATTCAIFFKGGIYSGQTSLTAGTNEFIIKNSVGTIVAKVDSSGNFYARGVIGQGCSCSAGTYSTPRDTKGESILHYTNWPANQYATGWCQVMEGCHVGTGVTTTNNEMSCRCSTDSYGCYGESCTNSNTYLKYSSVTCSVGCTGGSDCSSGLYCGTDGICHDLPICAVAYSSSTGYYAQSSSQDLWGDCGTTGCLTGNCDGAYSCGVYTDETRHNCLAGYVCDTSGSCTPIGGECMFDGDCSLLYPRCGYTMNCNGGSCCAYGSSSLCPGLCM